MAARRFPKYVIEAATGLPIRYELFATTSASIFSSLMPWQVKRVQEIFALEFGADAPDRVIDATAGIGGDTALFRLMWPSADITAIELETFSELKQNMSNINRIVRSAVKGAPVQVLHADAVAYLGAKPAPKASLVYFDPPWGGLDYHKAARLSLALGGRDLSEVAADALLNVAPTVIMKIPANADFNLLYAGIQLRAPGAAGGFAVHDVPRQSRSPKGGVAYRLMFVRRA
jgi:16S rRNA G966 N2-methylase RsmD